MRGDEGVVGADEGVVDVDGGLPAGAFEEEVGDFALPVLGDGDVALVPGDAEVVADGLGEVGDFDVAGVGVGFVFGEEPPAFEGVGGAGVVGVGAREGGDVLGGGGDFVAVVLGLEDAGEGDFVEEGLGEEFLGLAGVVAVEGEAPGAGEGLGGGWGLLSAEGRGEEE